MKHFAILFLILILCNCKPKLQEHVDQQKPNIVLFLVDDLGWTDLKSYGSQLYQTLNVDKLVKDGIKFTNAYAASTVCSPTRASIMTGKYPATINCTDWISGHKKPFAKYKVPNWTQHIRDEDKTLAEALKREGYNTIHVGKWHLGEEEKNWPEHHGFEQNIGGWKKGQPNKVNNQGGYFVPFNNPRLKDGSSGEYLTERLAKEAANYIKSHKEKPFFLNFWLYNVHTPLQAKKEKIDKYKALVNSDKLQSNPVYAAMVEHMDDALGTVINQLKSSGIYNNTIIIFASDNGGLTKDKGNPLTKPTITSNYPLRTGKGDMYEGGVRTPLVISWPNKITSGINTDVLAISPDIFPTIMGLIGENEGQEDDWDGIDLSEFLFTGIEPARDVLFWHYPHYHTEGAKPYSAIRKGDWKLIMVYEYNTLELYNLKEDIGESNNLVNKYPEKAEELLTLLNNWKVKVKAQEPQVNKLYSPEKESIWKPN
jgi:arylsulfatase A-like enzyme|tara:strand:- start:10580 stop:12025 length:1446 start_codon:yes stop_codon:yes gene_type:complete